MKSLTLILTLFVCLNLTGQTKPYWVDSPQVGEIYYKEKKARIWRAMGVIGWNIAASTIGAVGDAIRDDGNNLGWALNGVEAGMHVSAHWVHGLSGWGEHVAYYASAAFIRAGTFDITYNVSRGLPWYYTGSTKLWDQAWEALDPPPEGKGIFYGWSLTIGFAIPLKSF